MKHSFFVEDVVTQRYSVRTYEKISVEQEKKEMILAYAQSLKNPLGPKMNIQFIEKESAPNGEKLGTYGIIKGADLYLGATIQKSDYALEALGYEFEQLVLYATSLGLGTCWLGGTFNRSAFISAMQIGADGRLSWNEIFFKDSFEEVLSKEDAGDYKFPLEMLRLAPSAVNKQPWRVVVAENAVHFFEKHSMKVDVGSVDMQRIDVGIGICHFHLAVLEQKIEGHFERVVLDFHVPKNMSYIVSWIRD